MYKSLTLMLLDCARFVDRSGTLKPAELQASQLYFDNKAESMGESKLCFVHVSACHVLFLT